LDTKELRKQAILMYLRGMAASYICKTLTCSRPWFYKWLKRYQMDPTGDWFIEHSRRPLNVARRIDGDTENIIIRIRHNLENMSYAQIGAISIQWELHKMDIEPPPVWTINRIIKRRGLRLKKDKIIRRENEYPNYGVDALQQMDLVGPRYIKKRRIYFCNVIAVDSHCVQINPISSKASQDVVPAIVRFWQDFGIPDYFQMDNELSFHGSNQYPHSFGKLIRLVLSQGVTPLFIPQKEPWRNGIIEKFNDTFDKKFFRTQIFVDVEALIEQCSEFEQFHNFNYRYSVNQNKTPLQVHKLNPPYRYLEKNYQLPDKIQIGSGKVILIRFIRSDRRLNVFGEIFMVIPELVYHYVEAIISVDRQSLGVYLDNQLVQQFPYFVPVDWV